MLKCREIVKILWVLAQNFWMSQEGLAVFSKTVGSELAEANKENTLPYVLGFRERPHLLLGSIPVALQLGSVPLIYVPCLCSHLSEAAPQNLAETRQNYSKMATAPDEISKSFHWIISLPPFCKLLSTRNQQKICLHWLFRIKDFKKSNLT